MNLIIQGIYSFFCVAGFSIMFNLPRRLIVIASINGSIGWMFYVLLQTHISNFIIPAFIGSICVGVIGELLAIQRRKPATLFIIPGIIPFVPGYGIYNTMYHIVDQNFNTAIVYGAESMFIAISIACGIVLATSTVRMIRPNIERRIFKHKKT